MKTFYNPNQISFFKLTKKWDFLNDKNFYNDIKPSKIIEAIKENNFCIGKKT